MADINSVFGSSDYLKATDLQGRDFHLKITNVLIKEVEQGKFKPVISFNGAEKKLVCNKTNAMVIAEAYGNNTDSWTGNPIILYPARVDFQGKLVDAIRVRIPRQAQQQMQAPIQSAPVNFNNELNDDIPFAPEWRA